MDFRAQLSQLWAKYEGLTDREQFLAIGTICCVMFAIYLGAVLLPVMSARDTAKSQYQAEEALTQELRQVARNQPAQGVIGSSNSSLLAVVNDSAIELGINLKRVEPKQETSLRVWIDSVSFNQVINWLADLKSNHQVTVESISFDRTNADGYVNTAIVLERF